jgi:polyisoprenoid-binding protein YceI
MRAFGRTRGSITLAVAVVGVLAWAPASRAADARSWRVEAGDVKITVPLKPGGAFTATTAALAGTVRVDSAASTRPARLTGEITVDLATIDTGIALRNQHLRENYLQVAKGAGFDKAVLSDIHLADATGEGFEGSTPFTATLLLHGVTREVTGKAETRREGTGRRVRAEFPLTLTDFGVTPPEYLGVGVGNRLLVRVQFMAVPANAARR